MWALVSMGAKACTYSSTAPSWRTSWQATGSNFKRLMAPHHATMGTGEEEYLRLRTEINW